jgi:hypothetical protein
VNNRTYSSCIREIENTLSEDTKLTISLCKNTAIMHLWNEFSNYPILAIDCTPKRAFFLKFLKTILAFLQAMAMIRLFEDVTTDMKLKK